MIYLVGSIILTSYLTISFKILERFNIPVLPAIVFNYITCVITGSFVNGRFPVNGETVEQPWFLWACLMGTIFISLFHVIAFTAQKIGVAVATVANKLSLIIPFTFSIYLYDEKASWIKVTGIILALVAVLFTCLPKKGHETPAHKIVPYAVLIGLPAILFIGSGLLDTMIKYVEHSFLNEANKNDYLVSAFAMAASIGVILILINLLVKKKSPGWKSIVAGIAIGIPNYFSIWCLVIVLEQNQGESSAVIPINNMGIVLFSSLVAWLLLKESLTLINWIGIFISIIAISLIAFG